MKNKIMSWIDLLRKKADEPKIKEMLQQRGYATTILYCKINGWKHQAQKLQQEWDEKLKEEKQK